MQPPPILSNERARLAALCDLGVLDTPPEERFDRYTRLARRLFGVPIALVSLVDHDRQWFKSRQGIEATQTPRSISFCGHALALPDDVMLVEDARDDPRFHDNPLVAGDPNIRFYAGCPLVVDGFPIGTLCVIDATPRTLSDDDIALLRDLGAMVVGELTSHIGATTDALTGLSNRRGFASLAKHSLATCRRQGWTASLMYVDLDGFKHINDEHGHAQGDVALREMATLLTRVMRAADVVARLGGDEFCVLCPGAGPREMAKVLFRLRAAVDAANEAREAPWSIAFSAGVIELDLDGDIEAQLAAADERMYVDKRARTTPPGLTRLK